MPRPVQYRCVGCVPRVGAFGPLPEGSVPEDALVLQWDEMEAIRLADLVGMHHEHAADEMNVSRQTFGRILDAARAKIAAALVHGQVLRVQGGAIEMSGEREFVCSQCKHTWSVAFGTGRPDACPQCGSPHFHRAHGTGCCGRQGGQGHGRRHRHGAHNCTRVQSATT